MLWKLLLILVIIGSSACSSMPEKQVTGMNQLTVTEHKLPQLEVMVYCADKLGIPVVFLPFIQPLACATITLEEKRCDIYYAEITAWLTLEHEREHCAGKWHDDSLQEYVDRFNEK